MRPSLPPGTPLFRLGSDRLQLGCHPGVLVPDRPGLHALLRSLDGARDLDALRKRAALDFPDLSVDVEVALRPLLDAGILVDVDEPRASSKPIVGVRFDAPAAPLALTLIEALTEGGVGVGPAPDVTVLLSTGEPDRGALRGLVRSGIAHLPVLLHAESVRLGPWVVPGQTPCVECVDLHRSAWDPAWSALLPQFGQAVRDSAVPPAVRLVAAATVVDEIERFAARTRPRTWSSLVQVTATLEVQELGDAAFHPRCACSVLLAA